MAGRIVAVFGNMVTVAAEQVDEAIGMLRDVCEDFSAKGTGIVFTLPVSGFVGPG